MRARPGGRIIAKVPTRTTFHSVQSFWVTRLSGKWLGVVSALAGNNRTGWSDPRYDDFLARAAREIDRERRFELFRQAEQLLGSEGTPSCPLYDYVGVELYDGTRLGGVQPNLLDVHPLREMYLKTAR